MGKHPPHNRSQLPERIRDYLAHKEGGEAFTSVDAFQSMMIDVRASYKGHV